ncbi:unnamed protein product [Mytilus edulis]|uniref:Uncharacterized protein n=1 Tax=Mytilus edulis TaxID=6550 RepID=A0A8S3S0I4_MYTED|nr:unnamed protein product [Mytilus edulis]
MDNIVNCNKSNANTETLSDQTSQSCSDSDSDMSNNVMIGNRGDGYENPYQTVLQTRPESHRYVEIANERHTSISSTDSNKSEEQILHTGSTKEAVSIIVHVALCVKLLRRSGEIHSNVNEDRTYHTYDEIESIPYGVVSNVRPSETNNNQGKNLKQQHADHISNEVNVQSSHGISTEINADFSNNDLPQHEVSDAQHISFLRKTQTL